MHTLHPAQVEALSRLPSLKGAPLSIFVAMLIAQQPLQAHELQTFTGLSSGAITRGLKTLANLRAVISTGQRGWVLSPNWRQLTLPLEFLPAAEGEDRKKSDLNRKKCDSPPLLVVSSRSNREKEDLPTNHQPAENHKKSESGPENTVPTVEAENTVLDWLVRGGIAPGSPKMRLLVQKIQSPAYAKAHVLEHLHERREWQRHKNGREPGTGTLIYRLEHDWPPYPMRCPDCLAVEKDCRCHGRYYIPPEWEGVVKR